jgi:hypothetical protein
LLRDTKERLLVLALLLVPGAAATGCRCRCSSIALLQARAAPAAEPRIRLLQILGAPPQHPLRNARAAGVCPVIVSACTASFAALVQVLRLPVAVVAVAVAIVPVLLLDGVLQ